MGALQGLRVQDPLGSPGAGKPGKEECLAGPRVICCNRIALSDRGFTLNIENA